MHSPFYSSVVFNLLQSDQSCFPDQRARRHIPFLTLISNESQHPVNGLVSAGIKTIDNNLPVIVNVVSFA